MRKLAFQYSANNKHGWLSLTHCGDLDITTMIYFTGDQFTQLLISS